MTLTHDAFLILVFHAKYKKVFFSVTHCDCVFYSDRKVILCFAGTQIPGSVGEVVSNDGLVHRDVPRVIRGQARFGCSLFNLPTITLLLFLLFHLPANNGRVSSDADAPLAAYTAHRLPRLSKPRGTFHLFTHVCHHFDRQRCCCCFCQCFPISSSPQPIPHHTPYPPQLYKTYAIPVELSSTIHSPC